MLEANGGSGAAPGRSAVPVRVSRTSKMRSAAAIAPWMFALTRLSFLTGPYISRSAVMNDVNSPAVRSPAAISRLPYQRTPAMNSPPTSSITDGRTERALVTRMTVR